MIFQEMLAFLQVLMKMTPPHVIFFDLAGQFFHATVNGGIHALRFTACLETQSMCTRENDAATLQIFLNIKHDIGMDGKGKVHAKMFKFAGGVLLHSLRQGEMPPGDADLPWLCVHKMVF